MTFLLKLSQPEFSPIGLGLYFHFHDARSVIWSGPDQQGLCQLQLVLFSIPFNNHTNSHQYQLADFYIFKYISKNRLKCRKNE